MTEGTPQEVLTRIFRVFDVNRLECPTLRIGVRYGFIPCSDGVITKKELKKLLKDMHGLIKADDATKATEDMIATTTLAEMDENCDGKITLDEYIEACLGKDEFSKMLTLKIIDIFIDEDEAEEGEPAE